MTNFISAIGGLSSSSGSEPYTGIKTNTKEKTTTTEKTIPLTENKTTLTTKTKTTTTFKPCKDTEWQCDSGDGIHSSYVCNYDHDCPDKSDECSKKADCRDTASREC